MDCKQPVVRPFGACSMGFFVFCAEIFYSIMEGIVSANTWDRGCNYS